MAVGVGLRRHALVVASLVRVPNLFTASPDVLLGAALAVAAGQSVRLPAVGAVAVVSVFLYAGGTTLNDAVDAPRDAVYRPTRPIPRGHVSRRAGYGLALALLVAGVLAARAVSRETAGLAALLVAATVLYDGFLNDTSLGFLAMGLARGLNVVLGVTVGGTLAVSPQYLLVPLLTGGYVAAVTLMAAGEIEGKNRGAVAVAGLGALLATAGTAWYATRLAPPVPAAVLVAVLALAFVLWTARALVSAYVAPFPSVVGAAVGSCVLALVVLDAALAAVTGPGWGLAALAFLAPAVALARVFDVS